MRLRSALLRYAGSQVILISVPWYLEEPRLEAGIDEGEKVRVASQRAEGDPAE